MKRLRLLGRFRRVRSKVVIVFRHPPGQLIVRRIICLGLSQLIFFVNFVYSLFRGQVAGRNPWHSNTLEWTTPSPPPHGNFVEPPLVRRGPYEYSVPGMEQDYLPQTDPQPSGVPVMQPGH